MPGDADGSVRKRKQVYWGKTRSNQLLFTRSKDGHKQEKRSRPKKLIKTSKDDGQQYQRLQLAKQPTEHHTPQLSLSPPQGKPPPINAGRLIQPNNLLKVPANVQSLSPKIDELIALIQVETLMLLP